jgi:hypothetical protein
MGGAALLASCIQSARSEKMTGSQTAAQHAKIFDIIGA